MNNLDLLKEYFNTTKVKILPEEYNEEFMVDGRHIELVTEKVKFINDECFDGESMYVNIKETNIYYRWL